MSKRLVDLLLDDICEAIDRIEQYISGMSFDVFSKDRKSVDAVSINRRNKNSKIVSAGRDFCRRAVHESE